MRSHGKISVLSVMIGSVALFISRSALIQSSPKISNELRLCLQSFDIPASPKSTPTSYVAQTSASVNYAPISPQIEKRTPDTTVVILNWSRLQNVILISSVLCGPWLSDVVAEVFVWNNDPNITLTTKTFREAGCPKGRLRILNSPTNELFQARYIACTQSRTPYCFTQDDDYLVQPDVIRNLHFYFSENPAARSIHLLPAHEHLLSRLRVFITQGSSITTAFAWLGHGTYLRRSATSDFLDLLHALNATDDEIKMADNYFTILANSLKVGEIWFDHGIELGGEHPFTIGTEGDDRNDRHIARSLEYLFLLASNRYRHPYVSEPVPSENLLDVNVTPCRVSSCLVTSNIPLLLRGSNTSIQGTDMASLKKRRLHNLDPDERDWYIRHPLSNLVDARPSTVFQSPKAAREGEWIILDVLRIISNKDQSLQLSFLTEKSKEDMFQGEVSYGVSVNGVEWTDMKGTLNCVRVDERNDSLIECNITVERDARCFRLMISGLNSLHERWNLYEIWLRYLESPLL